MSLSARNLTNKKLLSSTDELTITCAVCTIIGDFSLSGGGQSPFWNFTPDSNFSSEPFDFVDLWAGIVVEDFDVHMEFDFLLTPKNNTNEVTVPLIKPNGLTFSQGVR